MGTTIDTVTARGETVLYLAVDSGDVATVQKCLTAGANVTLEILELVATKCMESNEIELLLRSEYDTEMTADDDHSVQPTRDVRDTSSEEVVPLTEVHYVSASANLAPADGSVDPFSDFLETLGDVSAEIADL